MPEGLHSGKMTDVGAVWEELLPMRWTHGGKLVEYCLLWEVPHTGAGEGLLEQWVMN